MIIVGVNAASTQYGMKLNDGGASILVNGKLVSSIAEERLSRVKYDAGFNLSLPYVLKEAGVKINDVDYFVVSSCSEEPLKNTDKIYVSGDMTKTLQDFGIPPEKIMIADHHFSHALSAYFMSPFDTALIFVIDGEGNIIGEPKMQIGEVDVMNSGGGLTGKKEGIEYWKNLLSRQTQYIAHNGNIQSLHTDIIDEKFTGMAETYRYFTTALGFGAYVNAGKVMGLSSYGKSNQFGNLSLLDFNENTGEAHSRFIENYGYPHKALSDYFKMNGLNFPKQREKGEEITDVHEDLAAFCQEEFTRALISKIDFWVKKTGIKNVCVSGGGALNSLALGKVRKKLKLNMFVPPAPGDSGQSIGNAYYGAMVLGEKIVREDPFSPFLGKDYNDREIDLAISENHDKINVKEYSTEKEWLAEACKLLLENKIGGIFLGKSECGPRALGNRSIIASPLNPDMKDKINKEVKFREPFRPFAPSVAMDKAKEYFEINGPSYYMSFVEEVNQEGQRKTPATTHVDNTARLQTVDSKLSPEFHSLLNAFGEQSGVPVLLNTSFNIMGDPIVETPEDAIETLLKSGLDFLLFHKKLILKNKDETL